MLILQQYKDGQQLIVALDQDDSTSIRLFILQFDSCWKTMLFIAVYSNKGPRMTPQNMLLVRRCKYMLIMLQRSQTRWEKEILL